MNLRWRQLALPDEIAEIASVLKSPSSRAIDLADRQKHAAHQFTFGNWAIFHNHFAEWHTDWFRHGIEPNRVNRPAAALHRFVQTTARAGMKGVIMTIGPCAGLFAEYGARHPKGSDSHNC